MFCYLQEGIQVCDQVLSFKCVHIVVDAHKWLYLFKNTCSACDPLRWFSYSSQWYRNMTACFCHVNNLKFTVPGILTHCWPQPFNIAAVLTLLGIRRWRFIFHSSVTGCWIQNTLSSHLMVRSFPYSDRLILFNFVTR